MSHLAQRTFVGRACSVDPRRCTGKRILELGSRNINGTIRQFFPEPSTYIGVDLMAGRDVDYVCAAGDYTSSEKFDCVVCCEMLHEDKDAWRSFVVLRHMVKPGGLVIITCAGPARMSSEYPDYFQPIAPSTLARIMTDGGVQWSELHAQSGRDGADTYFWALQS